MRFQDALLLAFRAVLAQRLRSFLTLLGIAVGIASVILLTSIGEGIHRFVLGEFSQFGTNNITVVAGKTRTGGAPSGLPSSARALTLEDAKALEHQPHVLAVTPNIRGNAEVEGNGRTRRALIYGVNAKSQLVFRSTVKSGQFLPADDENSARAFVVLGSKLKEELFGGESPLGQRL
ncbi:MAG: ABC transporter permease, partial [Rhodocyclales bacterium]|nr:ABC transporter permease [Rhodocyclales bacterium]